MHDCKKIALLHINLLLGSLSIARESGIDSNGDDDAVVCERLGVPRLKSEPAGSRCVDVLTLIEFLQISTIRLVPMGRVVHSLAILCKYSTFELFKVTALLSVRKKLYINSIFIAKSLF